MKYKAVALGILFIHGIGLTYFLNQLYSGSFKVSTTERGEKATVECKLKADTAPVLHKEWSEYAMQPSLDHEVARRKVERVSQEFWLFLRSELNKLKVQMNKESANYSLDRLLTEGADYQIILRNGFHTLANDVDDLASWRFNESMKLGDLVQRRLEYLQNPRNCSNARKVVCDFSLQSGLAHQLHLLTYCLIIAYATERTLIVDSRQLRYGDRGWGTVYLPLSNTCFDKGNVKVVSWDVKFITENISLPTGNTNVRKKKYKHSEDAHVVRLPYPVFIKRKPKALPMAVPEDLADRLMRFHGNPSVWWVGQFVKYLTRPNKQIKKEIAARKKTLGFQGPVVGVHVRRTDKLIREASYHGIEEYMGAVEEWFNVYEKRHGKVTRRVYLATDQPTVITEAKQRYTNYKFISDAAVTRSAGLGSRYSNVSLQGIVKDIHFLSHCNFMVCTFSSNVGRVAYGLMQTLHGDASQYAKSIDSIYFINGQNTHFIEAIDIHKAQKKANQIDLQPKDLVKFLGDHWNGYLEGINNRTGARGLFPSYKVLDTVNMVKMPLYPNVIE